MHCKILIFYQFLVFAGVLIFRNEEFWKMIEKDFLQITSTVIVETVIFFSIYMVIVRTNLRKFLPWKHFQVYSMYTCMTNFRKCLMWITIINIYNIIYIYIIWNQLLMKDIHKNLVSVRIFEMTFLPFLVIFYRSLTFKINCKLL